MKQGSDIDLYLGEKNTILCKEQLDWELRVDREGQLEHYGNVLKRDSDGLDKSSGEEDSMKRQQEGCLGGSVG